LNCQYCSINEEEHKKSDVDTLIDITLLTLLGERNPEAKPTLERVLHEWRSHALPPCNDFAHN
jgi:hypothetical protein